MAFDHLTFDFLRLAGIAVAGLALILTGCDSGRRGELTAAGEPAPPAHVVARGEYLVNTLGCHDCHTPWTLGEKGPEPDMTRKLSGHPQSIEVTAKPTLEEPWVWAGTGTNTAFYGPWGVSYAANLTPAVNGLKIWTEDMFIRAIRTGKHMGQSRPIAPPMPWPVYRNLTDEDLSAVYAYLRTIPPVRNEVPEYAPPVAAR